MQLPPIVQTGHPILRERAAEVTVQQIETAQFQQLVDTMIAVMRQAPGVGLAAPQIGVSMRVIVLEDTEQAAAHLAPQERHEREREPFPLRVFVNPVLRLQGKESRADVLFRPPEWYEEQQVEALTRLTVTKLSLSERRLELSDHQVVTFDKALLEYLIQRQRRF